jgi:drug/metabolite transporter (DMT)-like permease
VLSNLKYHIILHLIVLCWGLTGIFGDEISLSSGQLVFSRTLLASIVLLPILLFKKNLKPMDMKSIVKVFLIGMIVAIHWFLFFESIKVSTLSIGVICMSTTTLFIAFLEPLILGRKMAFYEIIIGVIILVGISVIFGFESEHSYGILLGLISAFCAAVFSVLNGKLIQKHAAIKITTIEMIAASSFTAIILFTKNEFNQEFLKLSNNEYIAIIILGVICTAAAFLASVWLMKYLSPFSVSVAINLEPIYTIIIAFIFIQGTEPMGSGFYIGSGIILVAVFSNSVIKKKLRQRKKLIKS